jgi:hypothetical protein
VVVVRELGRRLFDRAVVLDLDRGDVGHGGERRPQRLGLHLGGDPDVDDAAVEGLDVLGLRG